MKLKLFKASILFLILGLSLNSIGQNRYHVGQTNYDDYPDTIISVIDMKPITGVIFGSGETGIWETDCLNGRQHGVYEHFSFNGEKEEIEYKNGVQEGIEKQWYANGQQKYEIHFVEGWEHGKKTRWHENGQLERIEHYNYMKLDGLCQKWDENGKLIFEGTYKNGVRIK